MAENDNSCSINSSGAASDPVGAACELLSLIRTHADETERGRKLATPVVEALCRCSARPRARNGDLVSPLRLRCAGVSMPNLQIVPATERDVPVISGVRSLWQESMEKPCSHGFYGTT
jgi:hypothetical protein